MPNWNAVADWLESGRSCAHGALFGRGSRFRACLTTLRASGAA